MTGAEILKRIDAEKTADHCIIKSWRKEEDFIDFELIERFESDVKKEAEFEGFELIDLEQMWTHVLNLSGERLDRREKDGVKVVAWKREGGKEHILPYTAKTMLEILDMETKGNYVD